MHLKFRGRHFGFSTSGFSPLGRTALPSLPLDIWTVGIALLSRIKTEINVFQVYMPPSQIFHFRFLHVRSYSIATFSIGQLDPKNIGVAAIISLLSFASEDNCISSLEAAILDFPLLVASDSFTSISIGMGVPKNGGTAVEIMNLSCIEAEILLGSFSPPPISNVRP